MRFCLNYILVLLLCTVSFYVKAQQSDMLVLEHKGKALQRYYAGSNIEFVATNGAYRNALINRIANDTLYLQEFLVRRLPTTFGTYILDTAGSFRYAYHYLQIARFGKEHKGFNVAGSGAALLGGGILLTVASGVVYLVDREKFSGSLMGASAGLALAGYFLSKSGSKGIIVGKNKYRLKYIALTNKPAR